MCQVILQMTLLAESEARPCKEMGHQDSDKYIKCIVIVTCDLHSFLSSQSLQQ